MAELQDAALEPPPTRRDRSVEARKATRLKKGVRDGRIVDILNRGVSMPELATREGVTTLRRMQILVRNILAKRTPQPPTEYLALQVNRLNEAMIVAFGAMAGGNLKAVDRVVRIVGEMDRYHGFFPRRARARVNGAGSPCWLRSHPPLRHRPKWSAMEKSAQAIEKAQFGDGD